MRILKEDAARGEIVVRPDTVDDLWHLSHIVVPGDVAVAVTWRTPEEAAKDKIRASKIEKRPMLLGVRVEQVELHAASNRLRLLGVIVEGEQEIGAHHTINVEPRIEVTIRKAAWGREARRRLTEAIEAGKKPVATFLAVDDDEATVAVLRQMGLHRAAEVHGRSTGKRYEAKLREAREDYFAEILEAVRQQRTEGPLVVLGPGFWKDQFLDWARGKDAEAVRGAVVENTAHAGMNGVNEAIRRGVVDRIEAETRAADEIRAIEDLLEAIATGGHATYGEAHVERAVAMGAVARLLVTDSKMRKGAERILEAARGMGAEGFVVASETEAGHKLDSLGGIAAMLRYALPDA